MRLLRHVLVLACFPVAAVAQSAAAGQWSLHYRIGYRNLHTGEVTVSDEGGTLSLHVAGDSVTGYWQTSKTRAVRGTIRGDTVRVRVAAPPPAGTFFGDLTDEIVEWLKTHIHDSPTTVPDFELVVRGDSISGTRRTVTLEGEPRGATAKVSGVRFRGQSPGSESGVRVRGQSRGSESGVRVGNLTPKP